MSADADLNSDTETSKSTSDLRVGLVSEDGLRMWPLAWGSTRQGSMRSSTPEAETNSMATALKSDRLPVHPGCLEDKTTATSAVCRIYSPAVRHLPRTERISVGIL